MQQKTYSIDTKTFPIDLIDPHALEIIQKLDEAGFTAYLVGGSVRDLLLHQKPKDFDISTSAKPEEIKRLFRNCILIGKRFRLAHIRYGKKIFEVSTFRSGDNESDTLILRDNQWGTPEQDVLRRDFTINGMFLDPINKLIIDYVGGYQDIEKKYLRTIGQPFLRFKQDPVRMIRLLKFQARFGFTVDTDAHVALLECRAEILKSSPARILEELLRMLESGASRSFFKLMLEHGFIQHMLPDLGEFMESKEGDEVYSYLQEIDGMFLASGEKEIDRCILLSCLFFPMFQKKIRDHYIERNRPVHLGNIQSEAFTLLDNVFQFFIHLPRRLRVGLAWILVSQYRLTPIEKRRSRRVRVPNDPMFALSLQFLEIRACLEPGLQLIWEEWNEAYQSQGQGPEAPAAPKKRRRRPKRKNSESPPS